MEHFNNIVLKLESRLRRLPSPVLVLVVPFMGLLYITVIPTLTVGTLIFLAGKLAFHHLGIWLKLSAPARRGVRP